MRELVVGIDPGLVNLAVAAYHPRERWIIFRTYDLSGTRSAKALKRKNYAAAMLRLVDDLAPILRRAHTVAIEIQMRAKMLVVAQTLEAVLRARHPGAITRAVAQSSVRAHFRIRHPEYETRKALSIDKARELFGAEAVARATKDLGLRAKAADPFEAALIALYAHVSTPRAEPRPVPTVRTAIMRLPEFAPPRKRAKN